MRRDQAALEFTGEDLVTRRYMFLLGGVFAFLDSAVANAQAGPVVAPPAGSADAVGDSADALGDIVVTAQRRAERLQDVPIAVNSASAESLAAKGIVSLQNLNVTVPGLEIGNLLNRGTIFLRGVGSAAANNNNEPSVAVYVDGVYIASTSANLFEFNNIERVETLKGPQGTLFGRNATGGIIQVITRDPKFDRSAMEASLGYGNYDTVRASAYVATPISDKVAADIAIQYKDQGNGFGRNLVLDRKTDYGNSFGVRSKWLLRPFDGMEIHFSADYNVSVYHSDSQHPFGVRGPLDAVPNNTTRNDTKTTFFPTSRSEQGGVSLRVDQELNFARFASISSYRKVNAYFFADFDASPANLTAAYVPQDQSNWTQEFQLLSLESSAIDWVVGAFYYDSKADANGAVASGLGLAALGGRRDYTAEQTTKSGSVYGQATAEIFTDTRLTAGLRYTSEKQRFKNLSFTSPVTGRQAFPNQKQSFNKPTWRIALDHKFSRDLMAYMSYNRGLKSGGYTLLSPNLPGFQPETLDAYEVGFKSELFDRRMRFNIAAFYYDGKNIQLQRTLLGTVLVYNAARVRTKGIDGDFEIVPFRDLTLFGAFSILDGKYKSFPNAVTFAPSGGPAIVFDAECNRTPFTPKFV